MCIRDRDILVLRRDFDVLELLEDELIMALPPIPKHEVCPCLLYTSDAADERSSVDLGGRRIIKKKNR